MARKRSSKKKTPTIPALVKEHNLTERWHRGELVIEVGPDPDNPKRNVTRMRRNCAYEEMLARGAITIEQFMAAEKYAVLCEQASGASGDLYASINLLREGRNAWEPTHTMLIATGSLREIWTIIGKGQTEILNMLVIGNMSIKEIARRKHISSYHQITGQIKLILDRLDEFFYKPAK